MWWVTDCPRTPGECEGVWLHALCIMCRCSVMVSVCGLISLASTVTDSDPHSHKVINVHTYSESDT